MGDGRDAWLARPLASPRVLLSSRTVRLGLHSDYATPGQVAGGGRPGLGNAMFAKSGAKTSTGHHRTSGHEGCEAFVELELKTLAEVWPPNAREQQQFFARSLSISIFPSISRPRALDSSPLSLTPPCPSAIPGGPRGIPQRRQVVLPRRRQQRPAPRRAVPLHHAPPRRRRRRVSKRGERRPRRLPCSFPLGVGCVPAFGEEL